MVNTFQIVADGRVLAELSLCGDKETFGRPIYKTDLRATTEAIGSLTASEATHLVNFLMITASTRVNLMDINGPLRDALMAFNGLKAAGVHSDIVGAVTMVADGEQHAGT